MSNLKLCLLGTPHVALDNTPLQGFVTRKAEALLFYLAVTQQAHPRNTIAALFWPVIAPTHAKNNLRRVLPNLRKLTGDHLRIDRTTIAFDTQAAYWLDVERFWTDLAPLLPKATLTADDAGTLQATLALYRAEFLAGFNLADVHPFEEWLRHQRAQYHALAMQGFIKLSEYYLEVGEYIQGLMLTQRILEMEPWHEAGHRLRMQLLAANGQRADALMQYTLCHTILANELSVQPEPATTALYVAIRDSLYENLNDRKGDWPRSNAAPLLVPPAPRLSPDPAPHLAAALSRYSMPPTPHNLPNPLTPFFGRETEIAELVECLAQVNCRLITLFGEGGTGKTRLALAVGQALVGMQATVATTQHVPQHVPQPFPDGIWYIPLDGLHPTEDLPEQLAAAIAKTVGFGFSNSSMLRAQLLAYFQDKTTLLILDNFEELTAASDFLLELLQQSRAVKLLITSRRLLNLQAENVWSVTGLPTPAVEQNAHSALASIGAPTIDLADLQRYAAVALFMERAQRVDRTFQLHADNWQDVVAICRLSEGLPLAIELAASQVKLRSCATIRGTLTTQASALAVSYSDMPQRHRSLGTVLKDSWQLLRNEERTALAALAVFGGDFTPDAANAVAGVTPTISEGLFNKSMLQRNSHYRYNLHFFVRQFAGEQLHLLGPTQVAAAHATYGRYYLSLVCNQEQALRGTTPQVAVSLIQQDLLNIEAAWQWAVSVQASAPLAQSCHALLEFHHSTYLFTRGKHHFTDAVVMVQQQLSAMGTAASATADFVPSSAIGSATQSATILAYDLAVLLYALAYLLVIQNEHEAGISTVQQALVLAEKHPYPQLVARNFYVWGIALTKTGTYAAAEEKLMHALTLARTMAMTDLITTTLLQLGYLAKLSSNYTTARRYAEEALTLSRANFMVRTEQRALTLLGTVQQALGAFPEARSYYVEALPLAKTGNLHVDHAGLLTNLGVISDNLGSYGAAQEYYQTALAYYRHLGHRQGQALVLGNLGISADYLGDYSAALRYSQECLHLLQTLELTGELPIVFVNLALHAHHLGDHQLAQRYGRQALSLSQKTSNQHIENYAWTALGHAAMALEATEEAQSAYLNAIATAHGLALPFMTIEPLAGLVRIDLASGTSSAQLRSHVEGLTALITEHGVDGLEEPFRVYVTCYEGLNALRDLRAAQILQKAHGELQARAIRIDDTTLRRSFLECVAANRMVVDLYCAVGNRKAHTA